MWHVGQRSNSASKFPTSERLIVWVFEAWMIMSTCTRFGRSFWEELGIVREILYMYIWLYMHAACYLIHTQAIQVYICNLSTSGNIDLGSRFSELALGKKRGRVGHLSHHVLILTRCKVSMSNLGYPACCFLFVLAVYSWLIYSCLFSHFRSNSKMLIRGWSILASSYSSFFETWQTRPRATSAGVPYRFSVVVRRETWPERKTVHCNCWGPEKRGQKFCRILVRWCFLQTSQVSICWNSLRRGQWNIRKICEWKVPESSNRVLNSAWENMRKCGNLAIKWWFKPTNMMRNGVFSWEGRMEWFPVLKHLWDGASWTLTHCRPEMENKPPMTGNGNHTTEQKMVMTDWRMVYHCFTYITNTKPKRIGDGLQPHFCSYLGTSTVIMENLHDATVFSTIK